VTGIDEGAQPEGLAPLRGLGGEDEAPPAHAIGEGPRGEREEQDGRELERADQPELEGRRRELEDEPRLGHRLHPRARLRHELGGEESAKVGVVERSQPNGKGHRRA